MNYSRAAIRYSKATLALAGEHKAVDAVEKDMRQLLKTIADNPSLRDMLHSPVVESNSKKKALNAIFKGHHNITSGLISLLVDNKRIALLNEVALKYIVLNEEMKGKDVAYITTAVPLNEAIEKKALAQLGKITDKKVSLQNKVDKDILGGFILRVGDLQYDASIATKLNNIKREFSKSL